MCDIIRPRNRQASTLRDNLRTVQHCSRFGLKASRALVLGFHMVESSGVYSFHRRSLVRWGAHTGMEHPTLKGSVPQNNPVGDRMRSHAIILTKNLQDAVLSLQALSPVARRSLRHHARGDMLQYAARFCHAALLGTGPKSHAAGPPH